MFGGFFGGISYPLTRTEYHNGTPALADTALGSISHKMATPAARTKRTFIDG